MTWVTGYYQPTEEFLNIQEHRAVMRARDQSLIALCGPNDGSKETEANASLIAAAPAMLTALEEISRLSDESEDDFEHHLISWIRTIHGTAEQALATAKE